MIEEMSVVLRKQTPTPPNEWVYEEYEEYGRVVRNFKPFVYLGKNADPWPECTDQEKKDWEDEHQPSES